MRSSQDLISLFASIALFIALEACCILLIANNSIIQRVRLMGAVRDVQTFFWDKTKSATHYFNYKNVNEALFEENVQLRNALAAYGNFSFNIDTPSKDDYLGFKYIGARVVKNTVNRQHNYLIINKGEVDGIKEGMGVVTDRGIVGIVEATSNHYSYVISFLNNTLSVSVKISGNGIFGPMSWNGGSTKKATIRELPYHISVNEQDTVLTSGFSSIFPRDIPLGTVESISSTDGLSLNANVVLFEEYQSLDYVYVVSGGGAGEIQKLEENE